MASWHKDGPLSSESHIVFSMPTCAALVRYNFPGHCCSSKQVAFLDRRMARSSDRLPFAARARIYGRKHKLSDVETQSQISQTRQPRLASSKHSTAPDSVLWGCWADSPKPVVICQDSLESAWHKPVKRRDWPCKLFFEREVIYQWLVDSRGTIPLAIGAVLCISSHALVAAILLFSDAFRHGATPPTQLPHSSSTLSGLMQSWRRRLPYQVFMALG